MRAMPMLLMVLLVVSGPAEAQQPGLARPAHGKVDEGFDPTARVAGSRIVGVRIGEAGTAPFDPETVQIVEAAPDRTICVRAISRDGLYWMRTPYRIETAGPTIRLAPFTEAADSLRDYAADDIAIYAFESTDPDCLAKGEAVLPAVGAPRQDGLIEVLVNSGNRRVTARLGEAGKQAEMRCATPASVERITHDRVCTLPRSALPAEGGVLALDLTFDDGLRKYPEGYAIRIPGAPQ